MLCGPAFDNQGLFLFFYNQVLRSGYNQVPFTWRQLGLGLALIGIYLEDNQVLDLPFFGPSAMPYTAAPHSV